jgi:hypothetical protein
MDQCGPARTAEHEGARVTAALRVLLEPAEIVDRVRVSGREADRLGDPGRRRDLSHTRAYRDPALATF